MKTGIRPGVPARQPGDSLQGLAGPEWMDRAACRVRNRLGNLVYDPDMWFPHASPGTRGARLNLKNALPAIQVCRHCPVRQACLDYALQLDPIDGVWGGLTEQQRSRRRTSERQTA